MGRYMIRTLSMLVAWLVAAVAWADDITFVGRAPSAVAAGSQFRVEYTVNGRGTEIRCDIEGKGFDVLYGPTSSSSYSTSVTGGKVTTSSSTTFTYVLRGQKEGTYTLPAATVKVDGTTYTSNAVTVKVLPPDEQSPEATNTSRQSETARSAGESVGKGDVLLVLELSKTSAYENEAILASLKLYSRNQQIVSVADAKLPDFDGFSVQDIDIGQPEATLEHYNGANYRMNLLKQWVLFPQRQGEVEIPATTLTAVAQVIVRRSGGGFFDFPMSYAQEVEIPLATAARTVRVKPLPSGRPASYMGGVGDFQLKAETSSTGVKAGDAFVYKLTLSGTGNMKYVKEPEPEFPTDFEAYDPKVDLSVRSVAAGQTGKKTIEYTVIPRFAGTFQIPPVEFSYFDVKAGAYRTVQTDGFTIEVERGAGEAATGSGGVADFSGANQERLRVLGNDVRYLHTVDASALRHEVRPLYGTMLYWLLFLVPLAVFVIVAVVYRRQLRLNADTERRRTRKASKVASRRLKEASVALKAADEGAFYAAVHKAMLGYAGDKLSLEQSELSTDNLRSQLTAHGVADDIVERTLKVLSTCEFARYAPPTDSGAMASLYAEATAVIDQLEDTIKR